MGQFPAEGYGIAPKVRKWVITAASPDVFIEFPETTDMEGEMGHFFLQAMMNRMSVSYHKYGTIQENFPHNKNGIQNALQRIMLYTETGNLEWLVDAANYMLIEFICPGHANAHFRSTDSDESPGSVLLDGSIDHGKGNLEHH